MENILSAVSIGIEFGVSPGDINSALEEYRPNNNRSQLIHSGSNKIIMDAYNANPSSMRVALENFSKAEGCNKVVILGEMNELGVDSIVEHRKLIDMLNEMPFRTVILVGEAFKALLPADKERVETYTDSKELVERLKSDPLRNAYIFIKGSRSNRLEQLPAYL